jgi:hypothetical protein
LLIFWSVLGAVAFIFVSFAFERAFFLNGIGFLDLALELLWAST